MTLEKLAEFISEYIFFICRVVVCPPNYQEQQHYQII